ncbi:MAG: hypothetical protein JSU03_07630 [Bacteroidetes bacterium]|nr:hypothetical protein [Bacteroidota bacterium]
MGKNTQRWRGMEGRLTRPPTSENARIRSVQKPSCISAPLGEVQELEILTNQHTNHHSFG